MSHRLLGSLPEIAERVAQAVHLLICLDYDGTLAPIVGGDEVELVPSTHRLLRTLSGNAKVTLAVFDGVERAKLAERLNLPAAITVGHHGLEIGGPGMLFIEPTAAQFREAAKQIAADFESRLCRIPGVRVEDKGLSLRLDYRHVAEGEHEEFRRCVHTALGNANYPFVLREDHHGYEVRPRTHWNKGNAVLWIREQLRHTEVLTIYAGDDDTDEDAFAALQDGVTIKVGEPGATTAQYYVAGPHEIHEFLAWLLERLAESPRPARQA